MEIGEIMAERENVNYEDEIDLRELFKVLIKGKYIILFTTLICLIAAVAYVKIKPKQYSAISTLKFGKRDLNLNNSGPNEDISNYIYQLKSNQVLNEVIKKLDLRSEDGEMLTPGDLSKELEIKRIIEEIEVNDPENESGTESQLEEYKKLNFVSIKYHGINKVKIKSIVDTLSEIATEQISAKDGKELNKSLKLVEEQLSREEQNLKNKSDAITEYLKNNKSIHDIKEDIKNYQGKVDPIKAQLISLNLNIEINQKVLKELQVLVNPSSVENIKELKFDWNSGSISANDVIFSSTKNLPNLMTNIRYINVRNNLISQLNERDVKERRLAEYKKLLLENQLLLHQEEHKFTVLSKELALAKQKYDAYHNKEMAIVERAALDLGNTNVSIVSNAIVVPIEENNKMILLISLILGSFLGVFFVFTKNLVANIEEKHV